MEVKKRKKIDTDYVDSLIVREDSTTFDLISGHCVIVELTLKNGYIVKGEAAYIDNEDLSKDYEDDDFNLSKSFSRQSAYNKIWSLEGYLQQQRLSETS